MDGSTETNISGETSITYTPVAGDVGSKMKVKVSFTDDADNDESQTSDAYPATDSIAAAANRAPTFTSGISTTRSFTETIGNVTETIARNVGSAISATDADNDSLTYSLEGTDAGKFTVVSTSGQLQTKVGESYDREADASHSVRVKVVDGNNGSDTISVTNITERPSAPTAPRLRRHPATPRAST